ncbi:MAG: hypothetical protein Q4F11_05050 [Eubacteriales bacterium]|nr:hypothetical protein [Eubacteriales bacterium]
MKPERFMEALKKWKAGLSTQIRCIMRELQSGKVPVIFKGLGVIVITSYVFYENLLTVFFMLPYLPFYIRELKKIEEQKERLKEIDEFKDGILAVSFSLNVGYSVENAFREALGELVRLNGGESQTVKEFRIIVRRLNQNENLEDLLADYGNRRKLEDIRYFSEVFRFAKRSGGNLISVIQSTAMAIKEKAEVYRQIQTVISSKQMEKQIMLVIPYGVIVYLKLTAPELTARLYGSFLGTVVMTVCLLVLIISDYWAKRIVNIEV